MSEQYQKFKQNFFRQHPPSNQQLRANQQTITNQQIAHKQFKIIDPYEEYEQNRYQRNNYQNGDNLRIQNETHFPFEQLQQATFQTYENDPFLLYKEKQKVSNMQKSNNKNESSVYRNQFYQKQYKNYIVNSEYPQKQILKTQSHLQFRSMPKTQYYEQIKYNSQQAGIDKINKQLDKLRNSRKQIHNSPQIQIHNQNHQLQQKRQIKTSYQKQTIFMPPNFQINKQYLIQNNQPIKSQPPLSPPKQLPVIYNRPNTLSSSFHKVNPPTISPNNSRVIIQQGPVPNQNQHFVSPPNQTTQYVYQNSANLQPVIRNPINIQNPSSQISSGSRVIIQSQAISPNKVVIPSNSSIPSHSNIPQPNVYHIQPPTIKNQTPTHVYNEGRILNEGVVSIKQYERLKSECMMWQQRFYQVTNQMTRIQSQRNDMYRQGDNQQIQILREQNRRLVQKIEGLQNAEKNGYEKIRVAEEELLKKYQESLMKQCSLLIDRFRLEMKHNERY